MPADASARRVWATDACRQRGHRGRETQRARARPGSIVLRVAGRLVGGGEVPALTLPELAPAVSLDELRYRVEGLERIASAGQLDPAIATALFTQAALRVAILLYRRKVVVLWSDQGSNRPPTRCPPDVIMAL